MTQPNSLIVCPTSHMDWDWISSFEEYYKTSVGGAGTGPVQQILDAAVKLSQSEPSFFFSVAELGWLQRYFLDQGGTPFDPATLPRPLCLMGGAITSPDNIVCDGEVFVRAYLVGRQWARAAGLEQAIANVSWMPDDFGHDPEVPVILSAMGLSAVGFARVPGAFPNFNLPLDGNPSLACDLMKEGVAFNWQAGDGSVVFAHFMPNTYGVPFASSGANKNSNSWTQFVTSQFLSSYPCQSLSAVKWPGDIAFAPAGGDFSVPDSGWVDGVSTFNDQQNGTTARVGKFLDYVDAVRESADKLVTRKIDPSNFWTGLFGSRPALKALQARASRDLVAAETISSLLWLGAVTSSAALDALDGAIAQVWNILAPSSHHDFVTGTAPDRVYKMEQFPLLSLAANLAEDVYSRALQIIANSISPAAGHVVAVHNPVGVERSGIFRLERGAMMSFPAASTTVQPLADGGLLVAAPVVPSLGYVSGLVTFKDRMPVSDPVDLHDEVTLDNGTLAIKLSPKQLWAITSIKLNGGDNLLPSGGAANLIEIFNDRGNLYQYGNELSTTGFEQQEHDLVPGKAVQTEFGPLRWRVEAELHGTSNNAYRIEYTLIAGESLVRIRVAGSAPQNTTVATTFTAVATDGQTKGTHLIYGTAHHFHEDEAPPYWQGPLFKATHDFLMPAAAPGAIFPLAAIYHCGMPAWACADGLLLGSLFRNATGTPRGAAGTDYDTHEQTYALRISLTALDPAQGTPLVEALQAMNPLRAAVASPANQPENPVTLPATLSLASTPSPALVRVTRPMGQVKSSACVSPGAAVAFRIYQPNADGSQSSVELTMPVLTKASNATAALVTALEEPIPEAPELTVETNAVSVPTSFAITTVAVTATRVITPPTDGKGGTSSTCADLRRIKQLK